MKRQKNPGKMPCVFIRFTVGKSRFFPNVAFKILMILAYGIHPVLLNHVKKSIVIPPRCMTIRTNGIPLPWSATVHASLVLVILDLRRLYLLWREKLSYLSISGAWMRIPSVSIQRILMRSFNWLNA